jgi:diguanylate cyclase (GGDEF)-like protein/PAS domain S-box-containing protein
MGGGSQIEQFMPHGMCYLWNVRLLALHVISDAVIALAYFSIPIILLFFVRKRRDVPFPGVFAMFGVFIIACGMTHVLEIWTIWHPTYWLSGYVKALTACASLATAVVLVRIIPRALAMKGRADLSQQLAELNATLEQQVLVRTAKLYESERFFQAVADNIPSWVAYWDADSRLRFANAASLSWFGRTPESLLGLHVSEVLSPDVLAFDEPHIRAALAGQPQKFERKIVRPDGSNGFTLAHCIPDREGDVVRGFYMLVSDVTDFKETENELKHLAATDSLTGLSNRRAFDDILEREWRHARRTGIPLAMIMVDLDHFKEYNDYYGHPAGDECLKVIAGLLRSHTRRPADFVARIGGEEFVVLLPETGAEDAVHVADLLCDVVRAARIAHHRAPQSGFVTASFGVAAMVPDRDDAAATLTAIADEALYEAKRLGRDRVVCARPLPSLL